MADLMKFVQDEFVTRKDFPVYAAGDTITVYYGAADEFVCGAHFSLQEIFSLLNYCHA